MLHGAQDSEERERIKAAFQYDPKLAPVRILIATDSASEGIDLQRHCHQLIHYEIPWNPNRLEQRNGRVDRHGQRASQVLVYHFVAQGYRDEAPFAEGTGSNLAADLEFLYRAAKKVEQIREDLGKVGPVIAEQVEEAMLGRRRTLDTTRAERDNEPVKRLLRFEQNVRDQVLRLSQQLDETRRSLHLTPGNIEAVIHIALDLARQPKLIPVSIAGVAHAWRVPQFVDPSWALCRQGLAHPFTGEERPITFDPDAAKGRDDIVLAHLNHRLVDRCLRLLRAEVWAPVEQQKIHRVTARLAKSGMLRSPVIFAHARLTVVSRDSQRLHEELITAGGSIVEDKFDRLNVSQTAELMEAASNEPAPVAIRVRLAALWPSLSKPLQSALDARGRDRTQSVQRQLAERSEQDLAKMDTVLTELERTIRAELKDDPQLSLFEGLNEMEREQARRNRDFLEDRLRQIPLDRQRETEAIRQRYADPEPRLFPVAVTFLVPEGLR
jgi:Helicase conserved C-terminal domain